MKQALMGLVLALGMFFSLGATAAECSNTSELAYIGTDGTSLRALRLNACAGQLAVIGPVAEVTKPRWLVAHPKLPLVYAAFDGGVIAYAMDRKTGALTKVNEADGGGAGTTFLAFDAASSTLLTANFGAGSVGALTVKPDGSLGDLVSTIKATGSGPHRRQTSPHAHSVSLDSTGRYALVADLGADRIFVYRFDRTNHKLSEDSAFATPSGSGPRRALFGASGRFVYALNELTAEVMVLRWDAPRLSTVQTLPLSSADFQGTKSASEIAVSHDGRFVYVANRGENTLMVFSVNAGTGELTLVQRLPSGGEAPWAFDLHPSGKWLLVANYRSNRLNLFSMDAATGQLKDIAQALESPGPVSVTFVNQE